MGSLGKAICTVHLISPPDQGGMKHPEHSHSGTVTVEKQQPSLNDSNEPLQKINKEFTLLIYTLCSRVCRPMFNETTFFRICIVFLKPSRNKKRQKCF